MSITYSKDINIVMKNELNQMYGNTRDYYSLFEKSFLKVFAFDESKVVGAVRVISEGLETALLVDLKVLSEYGLDIKKGLILELEKELIDRRVMVYSNREDVDFFEGLGYGRCKNAWTYFKEGLDEQDFLPAGYRYENEFITYITGASNGTKKTEITYKIGHTDASFEDINDLLTQAFGRPHDLDRTTSVFTNSQYSVSAFDGDKLVGVARAVSDKDKYANILNVAVNPEYQGMSIGRNIVLKLSEIIEAEVVVLNTHPGAVGFYNRLREYRRNKYVFEKQITVDGKNEMPPERRAAMFTPAGYKFPDEY